MKIRFIHDVGSVHSRNGYEIGDDPDGNPGYASDIHVDSRLAHEKTDYHEALYRQVSKYFDGSRRSEKPELIDIPDEIMLQYMLEGVFDFDFLAYDYIDAKMCISNTKRIALRYGDEYNFRRGRGAAGSSSNKSENDSKFFNFSVDQVSVFDKQNDAREQYTITPDGEHYKNILECIQPYVQYNFINIFKICSDMIRSTQKFFNHSRYLAEDKADSDSWYESSSTVENLFSAKRVFQPDEYECRLSWDIRYDTFLMCLEFWRDDHPLFLSSRNHLSDYEVESFQLLDARIKSKISETK